MNRSHETPLESAVLGGGCFWCVEAVFERLAGVIDVTSGYAGGPEPAPTYQEVCSGQTGHAEVVKIDFDPAQISFAEILDVFWQAHNPTSLNRQGADIGPQYRSIILHQSEEQRQTVERSMAEAQKQFDRPIVTEIKKLEIFYPGEDYHQDYYRANSAAPYCFAVIHPKLRKLESSGAIPPAR